MLRKPHYIALSAVAVLALILLNLPDRTATQLKLALGGLFLPLFGLAGSAQNLTEQAGKTVASRRSLLSELDSLRRDNQELRLRLLQSTQVWHENARLRQAVNWPQRKDRKVKLGRVIAREPSNWWRALTIDLGARNGVAANQPVLTPDGLVGRVSEVGFSTAKVLLIGDPNCRVAAKVVETGDHGVLGLGAVSVLDQSLVEMTFLPAHSQVKPGHKVMTSGLGGVFPDNIPLGRVVDTSSVGHGMYTEARVKLAADFDHLEEVWVMFP